MDNPSQPNDVQLDDLYRDTVLDHFRTPRGRKPLDRVDRSRDGHNPICGDRMTVAITLDGDRITDVAVDSKGCAISVASGSMLAELVPGLTATRAREIIAAFKQMMRGQPPPADLDIGDLDTLGGIKNFPVRVKCALLAWMTLDDILQNGDHADATANGVTITE